MTKCVHVYFKGSVQGVGFRATSDSDINGTTNHNLFRVWVVDLSSASIVAKFGFGDNSDGFIVEDECVVMDYNRDGNDDLIILREKNHPSKAGRQIKTVQVFNLLTKALMTTFSYEVIDE